jgi:TetR/AcrR family transcriptional regulator, cholesterol catabolism regulator
VAAACGRYASEPDPREVNDRVRKVGAVSVDSAVPATKPSTAALIRSSAIDLFFEHGYEATSLRAIAGQVGIQVGSLYNHLTSKESLLYSIMSTIMEDLLREFDSRLAPVTDSVERLRTAIEVHVLFHTARAREVFIGNSELRSLTAAHRRKVVKLRDQYEERFIDIIEQGVADRSFEAPDPKLTAWAILAVGTSTSTWFRPDGRLQLDDIARLYTDFVLNGLATGRPRRR